MRSSDAFAGNELEAERIGRRGCAVLDGEVIRAATQAPTSHHLAA
jgi:hypothetical protein